MSCGTKVKFWGYRRPDGRVGIRNHVAIVSAMDNSNPVVRRIANLVRGTIPVCCSYGRGLVGKDYQQHLRTLIGLATNPNVAAAIVISLEPVTAGRVAEGIAKTGRPVEVIALEDIGGTIKATELGMRLAQNMVIEASRLRREEASIQEIILGVECGGSDSSSGVASNPVTGYVSDQLVEMGGTVIMSETVEWMGAEHILARRAVSRELAEKIYRAVAWYEEYAKSIGIDLRGTNPAPDNIAGGLSTIEEKALGAIQKAGTAPIQGLLEYAERPEGSGLYLMDAPPPGVENVTALAAGGCQVVIFSTGKGNPLGNPVVPVIKVSGNPQTVRLVADNIDIDVSAVLQGKASISEEGVNLWNLLLEICNGKLTKSEVLAEEEISISRIGFSL